MTMVTLDQIPEALEEQYENTMSTNTNTYSLKETTLTVTMERVFGDIPIEAAFCGGNFSSDFAIVQINPMDEKVKEVVLSFLKRKEEDVFGGDPFPTFDVVKVNGVIV